MDDMRFNSERYRDPTTYLALRNILREEEYRRRRRKARHKKRSKSGKQTHSEKGEGRV